jgi:imidazolonepropionase-like amidohydrolase
VQLRNQIKGDKRYPFFYVSGPGIATFKGQFPENANPEVVHKEYTIVDSKSDPDKLLQSYLNQKVDILKIYMDNSPGKGGMDEALLKKILTNPKIKKFKKVTFHASEIASFEMGQRLGVVNLEHANQIILEMDKNSKIHYITPTDQDVETLKEFSYYKKPFYELQSQRLKLLYKKNIKLVFGPDFYFHNASPFNRASYVKRTLKTYMEAEIPNKDILRALTINPASSLHEEGNIGVIKTGAWANLIGFKKNPLEDVGILLEEPVVMNRGQWLKKSK